MIIIVAVIFGGTFAWDGIRAYFTKQFFATYKPPPVSVSTTTVKKQSWQPTLHAVGSVTAVNGVNVNAEVSGQVRKIHFKSGQMVTAGQPLIQLDDSIDQETLKNNMAELTLAKINYDRQVKLIKTRSTSRSQLDNARAKYTQAQAAVDSTKVMIDKKLIKAPFAGSIGNLR